MLIQQVVETPFRIAIEESVALFPFTISILERYVYNSTVPKRTAEPLHYGVDALSANVQQGCAGPNAGEFGSPIDLIERHLRYELSRADHTFTPALIQRYRHAVEAG